MNDAGAFFGDGFQNRSNQFRIWGQGDVFLGPGANGGSGGLGIGAIHATGDDGRIDTLRQQGLAQAFNVQAHVDQDDIGPFTIAQMFQPLVNRINCGYFRAALNGNLAGTCHVPFKGSDDK